MVGGMPKDDQAIRLWFSLVGCFTTVERELRRRLRSEFDLSLPRFDVLTALVTFPDGLTMTDLAGKLGVSKGNVTGVVGGLREQGLIKRTRLQNDRRVMQVVITERGKSAWNEMQASYRAVVESMLNELPAKDARGLTTALTRLQQILDRADNLAGPAN
jgi:DNA-binding MarR family transcriptional regulator